MILQDEHSDSDHEDPMKTHEDHEEEEDEEELLRQSEKLKRQMEVLCPFLPLQASSPNSWIVACQHFTYICWFCICFLWLTQIEWDSFSCYLLSIQRWLCPPQVISILNTPTSSALSHVRLLPDSSHMYVLFILRCGLTPLLYVVVQPHALFWMHTTSKVTKDLKKGSL